MAMMNIDAVGRERLIPSQLTGSIDEAYFSGLTDVSDEEQEIQTRHTNLMILRS